MPQLSLEYGLGALRGGQFYQVDMDEWAYSANTALATWGAGPCLNVVVHAGAQGCLSHIWNSSLNQTELYHKACFTIRDMIHNMGIFHGLEIWLGAGHAFGPDEYLVPEEKAALDFPVYLTAFLGEVGCQGLSIIDNRTDRRWPTDWNPGDIAYSPPTGKIYLISDRTMSYKESGVYTVQTNQKSPRRGTAR
ncbi:MAG TPA: hypothetical protein VGC21_01585 [Telluria sp.]|jgi:hypothetical protein